VKSVFVFHAYAVKPMTAANERPAAINTINPNYLT
jgi:hypothetical protein